MTNDLTVYKDEQIFSDKCPYLSAGYGVWTAEQQARYEGKREGLVAQTIFYLCQVKASLISNILLTMQNRKRY